MEYKIYKANQDRALGHTSPEQRSTEQEGKYFGSRGRGFSPVLKAQGTESRPGRSGVETRKKKSEYWESMSKGEFFTLGGESVEKTEAKGSGESWMEFSARARCNRGLEKEKNKEEYEDWESDEEDTFNRWKVEKEQIFKRWELDEEEMYKRLELGEGSRESGGTGRKSSDSRNGEETWKDNEEFKRARPRESREFGGARPKQSRDFGGARPKENRDFRGARTRENRELEGAQPRENRELEGARPRSTYIPEEPTEDETEIFATGISSGVYFDKLDDIRVNVTGENPPQPVQTFEEAGLCASLVSLIQRCNYAKPTPVQKHAIPIIKEGRDVMACAQTGSGKTAAYLIPIINNLLENGGDFSGDGICRPRAMIVSPTRELTIQIFKEARKFSHGTDLKVAISYGGTSVKHQIENISHGCHILVATPGRLLDFVSRKKICFSEIKCFVLDEADKMLEMGFLSHMKEILTHPSMPNENCRQTLMFSATFPEEIQHLATKFMKNYLFISVGIVGSACADVEQRIFLVKKFDKRLRLFDLLKEKGPLKTLVFVEKKRMCDFMATYLCEKDLPSTSIHGDREQYQREEALRDFRSGKMNNLVATSVAARGLDIKDVAHVVNFDLPKTIEEYVHRIGRTGRVGNRGLATSFFDPQEDLAMAPDLVRILELADQSVPDFLRQAAEGKKSTLGLSRFVTPDYRIQDESFDETRPVPSDVIEDEFW